VHECVVAATFKLDEAETLVGVEKLDRSTTLPDDLARPATRTTAAAKTTTARSAEATTLAAAEPITATAEAITAAAAEPIVATTPTIITTAEPITTIAAISLVECHLLSTLSYV
jgi:hypothetical protein